MEFIGSGEKGLNFPNISDKYWHSEIGRNVKRVWSWYLACQLNLSLDIEFTCTILYVYLYIGVCVCVCVKNGSFIQKKKRENI